ncbi:Venom phosphodiesterase 2 [Holothuria leucospilota]|uniref:Venom phosphodiesterase 2 n=1 Tax=Holothuria leucospilota TaxID=206669 RepID=A0A9Q1BUG6_HOLLE|nr:Venom phosphodiesterase 2 [Holothuria leucospilota]
MSSGFDNPLVEQKRQKDKDMHTNGASDPENHYVGEMKSSKSNVVTYCIVGVCTFCVALGIGFGCGFVVGNNEETLVDETLSIQASATWLSQPCMTTTNCPANVSKPPLIIVSLDGFRYDFLDRGLTPNIEKLQNCGAKAEYMIPAFPSITFSNHYSIATGLYPESHGIVGNSMYDPALGSFSISSDNKFDSGWWGGEPIWNTAQQQGLRTATYFWVGSDVEIQGMRPDYWFLYAETEFKSRVEVLVSLLAQPEGLRPDFLTLYYDEPDHTGHSPGPDTPEEDTEIARMDGLIGYLMDSLMRIGMHECINVIVVADHGMANRSCDQLYVLDDYVDRYDYYTRDTAGTMLRLDPKSSSTDPQSVVDQLACKHEVAVPYLKWNTPKRWHYMNNLRIEDILVTVPEGWTASDDPTTWCDGGTHGYDNLGPKMRALFAAHGPAFKSGVETEPFQNIELYELMCEILEISPAPNNGTRGALHDILKSPVPLAPKLGTSPTALLECNYPIDDVAYDIRLLDDITGCACTKFNQDDIKYVYDFRLNTIFNNVDLHAPFGLPVTQFQDLCELQHQNYLTMYSHNIGAPLYATFTIDKDQIASMGTIYPDCSVRPDVRIGADVSTLDCPYLNSQQSGQMTNIGTGYLYPPIFGQGDGEMMDGLITSNTVPQYQGFNQDMWQEYLWRQVPSWADSSNGVNVITGPIYDVDKDGLIDSDQVRESARVGTTLVPTHMFAIFTRCKGGIAMSSDCTDVESVSFIVPNIDGIYTCESQRVYLENNRATINDVEKLTGLDFFPNLDEYQRIHLKSRIHSKGAMWNDWPMN